MTETLSKAAKYLRAGEGPKTCNKNYNGMIRTQSHLLHDFGASHITQR